MGQTRWLAIVIMVAIITFVVCASPAAADAPDDRAGLVVAVAEDQVVVRTVALDGASLSGEELLERSGLGLSQHQGFVCSIAGVGCDYPDQTCMCALPLYWAYQHWVDNRWAYSGVGAAGWMLGPGDVDGWSWGSSIDLPDVDSDALLDTTRLAPGAPVYVPVTDALGIQLPFVGDADGDASVQVMWRGIRDTTINVGDLDRASDRFEGVALLPVQPGRWSLELMCTDPDGVNGSEVWRHEIEVKGTYIIQCPIILNATTQAYP